MLKAEFGADLNKEHERYLTKHFGNVPVFVTDFPAAIKPFYAKRNDDNQTVSGYISRWKDGAWASLDATTVRWHDCMSNELVLREVGLRQVACIVRER